MSSKVRLVNGSASMTNSIYPDIQASELLDSFEQLQLSLGQFHQSLAAEARYIWLPQTEEERLSAPAQQFASQLYCDIWHHGDGDGRETRNRHGLIGVENEVIEIASQLNRAKQQFKRLCSAYSDTERRPLVARLYQRSEKLQQVLQHSGASRLHIKQCYREIPLLTSRPHRVGFNWYNSGRSIRRVTVEDCLQMLLKMDTSQPHIQVQLDKLAHLSEQIPLAQLQPQVPVMRANIAWKENDQWIRKARNCPLPILFPLASGEAFPEHNEPDLTPPEHRSRAERSDNRIAAEAFLPSLRVHQYLN